MATWKKIAFYDDVLLKNVMTPEGAILYASANDTPAALPHGSEDDILAVNAGGDAPEWIDPDTLAVGAHSLDDHTAPDGAMDFGECEATAMVIMNSATPPSAHLGKWYFDITGTDLSVYLCTAV